MDGWTDGDQKCPLIFFILFACVDHAYTYVCMQSKLSPIFLWISEFDVKFQNLMSSWGSWSKISKLQVGDFSFFGSESSLLVSKVSFNYVYTFTIHR